VAQLFAEHGAGDLGEGCGDGAVGARFATATPAALAGLRRAFSVVYRGLETDPRTSAFIRQIQALKKATPPGPAPAIRAGCSSRQ